MADLFKPGSFKLEECTSENHTLAIADDRARWFEAIRDPNDPLLQGKNSSKTNLGPADYLISVSSSQAEQTKSDFEMIKERVQKKIAQEAKEAAKKEKEANFLKGLLG